MHNQFRGAFEPIRATDQMKQNTCRFLREQRSQRSGKRRSSLRLAAVCCAIFVCVFGGVGGYQLYATPVSYISVDVNPSVELGLNRIDRVVTMEAFNDDGATVLQNLRLKHKPYTEAIELLLADTTFESYLTGDAQLSFTVISDKEETLLTGIQQCHGYAEANAQCHGASAQLVEDAHHNGLSFGKYQAFLELSQYDKTITAQECQALSMREIRDRISQYKNGGEAPVGGRHHGEGGGHGYRGGRGNS